MKFESGQRIFIHGQSAVPFALVEKTVNECKGLKDIEFIHLHLEGKPAHLQADLKFNFKINNLFLGPAVRPLMDYDRVDYTPTFLSEIPKLFTSKRLALDVALVHVSPPDAFGYCSLGVGVDIARAAVDSARYVLGQINPQMPRTHGDSFIKMERFDEVLEVDQPLPQKVLQAPENLFELAAIGRFVAELIEDGSTIQVGIGSIPDAVLKALDQHQHLGVHSEMWSDGVVDLLEIGAVDNSKKIVHPGKTISAFVQGTQRVYDFINDNPSIELYPSDYVNSPLVIARNPKVVAINSAVEVDLTGQVCSDSVGHKMISGVGGQIDFIRGASLCPDGKPIIAITSRTKHGQSRIVPELQKGAGVVTTRADVHYVVTEFGVADLYGKSLGQRAKSLIQIAHPSDRENLERSWHELQKQT
jgi:acyl-CoA hydrolase